MRCEWSNTASKFRNGCNADNAASLNSHLRMADTSEVAQRLRALLV